MTQTSAGVAIACGGTGGHLFPGLAVALCLQDRGVAVSLLVSPKEVDQAVVRSVSPSQVTVHTLPAVAMVSGHRIGFIKGFARSLLLSRSLFRREKICAVLAMGGFTSAPPILAGKLGRALTFLHEANSIPGRANRWLAPWVDEAFVYFPSAGPRLRNPRTRVCGMPVRPQFQPMDAGACRMSLGLKADRPTLLITGGSQGAQSLNEKVMSAVPALAARWPRLQYLHLTGPADVEKVRRFYASHQCVAVVKPFLTEMELAMNAATLALSRAGASSLAELAALRVPSVLVPYPAAADNHQEFNARAFAETGAALPLTASQSSSESLVGLITELLEDDPKREAMGRALASWHSADAAASIADAMMREMAASGWNGIHSLMPDSARKSENSLVGRSGPWPRCRVS
ncbi:MAG TPA: UDP-N-acetylglucosamine--N-acetylmuramyl-(pentapeptide) pyrophosphoryl-undecaprenol N-acetylglucosamine transferase [Candidatus Paceibacterota bacterium]|nr:UDP-N-acetylglucosamine--N-acetylmuramyl-(pentapeptide) pyrophosphoryl-undecaprenol N-acetylglucosamine transferase [Candidatus Paceibacterota bacterium]